MDGDDQGLVRGNIHEKGANSYYYAHAKADSWAVPEGAKSANGPGIAADGRIPDSLNVSLISRAYIHIFRAAGQNTRGLGQNKRGLGQRRFYSRRAHKRCATGGGNRHAALPAI